MSKYIEIINVQSKKLKKGENDNNLSVSHLFILKKNNTSLQTSWFLQ